MNVVGIVVVVGWQWRVCGRGGSCGGLVMCLVGVVMVGWWAVYMVGVVVVKCSVYVVLVAVVVGL